VLKFSSSSGLRAVIEGRISKEPEMFAFVVEEFKYQLLLKTSDLNMVWLVGTEGATVDAPIGVD